MTVEQRHILRLFLGRRRAHVVAGMANHAMCGEFHWHFQPLRVFEGERYIEDGIVGVRVHLPDLDLLCGRCKRSLTSQGWEFV